MSEKREVELSGGPCDGSTLVVICSRLKTVLVPAVPLQDGGWTIHEYELTDSVGASGLPVMRHVQRRTDYTTDDTRRA